MRELPLDKDDLLKLKGRKISNIAFLVIFVLFLGVLAFFIFRMDGHLSALGIIFFFVVLMIITLILTFSSNSKIDDDAKLGKKTVWLTVITLKYEFTIRSGSDILRDRRFYISLKEEGLKDIEVPRELLNKLNVGDEVYLEYANVSKSLIKFVVNNIEHSPGRISFRHRKNGIDLNKP